MRSTINPVTFQNKKGLKLFGMLHSPERRAKDVGIIILSPGIKSRVAPHRLYVKMAERFSEKGFHVLRFDPEGLGDSEGEIEEKLAADVYGSIQVGRYIDDTIASIDWMQKNINLKKVILAGLCGGAITGLLAGMKDQRIHSFLGLGIPVILDSPNVDPYKFITKGQLNGLREGYIRKIFSIKAWLRFFTFKTDFKILIKSLIQPVKETLVDQRILKGERKNRNAKQIKESTNFNSKFPLALKQFAASRKVLFIFSEADRLFWEFEEKYLNYYKQEFEDFRTNVEIIIVKDANHTFSFQEWQIDMLEKSCDWLKMNYTQINLK